MDPFAGAFAPLKRKDTKPQKACGFGLQSTQPKDRRFHRPLIGFHMAASLEVVANCASRGVNCNDSVAFLIVYAENEY